MLRLCDLEVLLADATCGEGESPELEAAVEDLLEVRTNGVAGPRCDWEAFETLEDSARG